MALKGDRWELYTDMSFFANSVMERGGVVCYSTWGSGAALDQSAALVSYQGSTSGQTVAGLLLQDMVNLDLTRQHPNWYRDEVQIGGKVLCAKKGFWVTNMLTQGSAAIAVGDLAVLTSSGSIMNVPQANSYNWNYAVNPKIGRFESTKDEDGYAKLQLDIL